MTLASRKPDVHGSRFAAEFAEVPKSRGEWRLGTLCGTLTQWNVEAGPGTRSVAKGVNDVTELRLGGGSKQ